MILFGWGVVTLFLVAVRLPVLFRVGETGKTGGAFSALIFVIGAELGVRKGDAFTFVVANVYRE